MHPVNKEINPKIIIFGPPLVLIGRLLALIIVYILYSRIPKNLKIKAPRKHSNPLYDPFLKQVLFFAILGDTFTYRSGAVDSN